MLVGSVASQAVAAGLSVLASFLFVLGLALQQKGNLAAMRAERAGTARRPAVLTTVLQPAWLGGMAIGGLLGFVALATALRLGSLTIVEPLQVTQMIFTIPLSAWVAHAAVKREEWVAALALVVGLGLLVVMAAPQAGTATGSAEGWRIAIPVALLASALFGVTGWRVKDYSAALLGASAGTLFGVQNALVKDVIALLGEGFSVGGFLTSWSPWAAASATLAAVVIQNLALRSGRLAAVQTTITTTGPIVSAIVGVTVFAETVESSPVRVIGALAGVVIGGWGVLRLARSPVLIAAAELTAPASP
jgi:drug/metabolite transporter (DMT)-like permease